MDNASIFLDSHVTVAQPGYDKNQMVLNEVYRIGNNPVIVTPNQYWSPGQKLQPRPSRNNFGGITINAAIIVRDSWDTFLDLRYRKSNTLSKGTYVLMLHISRLLNFTMNLTKTDTWGYPKKNSPCYDGVIGLLECHDVEISANGLLQREARMDRVDYAGETVDFGGKFRFLKPALSEISIIYTLPFKATVWIAYIVILAIMTIMLYISQRLEHHMDPTKQTVLFGDTVLNSVAVVCQEGTSRTPDSFSSRIIFLFILILSLFLTASYSAIIVSLLQTSSNAINDLKELLDSSFTLTMRDIVYNFKLVNDTRDPLIKKLFYERLYSVPYHKAFVTQEEGVENMRKGLYAFYGESDAYWIMSDTYEEEEKCMLKEIQINAYDMLAYPVKKGSQFRDFIKRKTYQLREAGLTSREHKIWFAQKPKMWRFWSWICKRSY
ncbi:hypothetical protein L9F63_014645 [Diploptera punctata]|uniref:Ionotropic glutamate receptor C-terminal domain-containing protein n=1 Tax=Diploptera punctata TaxID=6984 RepID=A0AAD8A7I2_DIPPU|nr:hypothetical protein L9F63_014645 [Diploptera punctata]